MYYMRASAVFGEVIIVMGVRIEVKERKMMMRGKQMLAEG